MNELYDFLKKAGVWYIATADDNGQPHIRPFQAMNIFEDKFYIQTGLAKHVAKQMLANPKIAIVAIQNGGTRVLQLTAEAVHDERVEAQQALLDANPELKEFYRAGDGNTAVFYLKNTEATITEDGKVTDTIRF